MLERMDAKMEHVAKGMEDKLTKMTAGIDSKLEYLFDRLAQSLPRPDDQEQGGHREASWPKNG